MSIRLRENHGFNLIHVQVMQISHILSCELHGSPIALSKHEVCSFRDILILIHLLHAGTFRLSEKEEIFQLQPLTSLENFFNFFVFG